MHPYLEMMRPGNCLMSAVAVLIGGLLVIRWGLAELLSLSPVYLAMAAAFLITGAGNAINDWNDVEADRVNRPKRPIPSGRASRKGALVFSMILFLAGIALAGIPPMNWLTLLIAAFNSLLLALYSLSLQGRPLAGNLAVSYLAGSTFLFGGAALGDLTLPAILGLLAGLATLSREVAKDAEDEAGDRLASARSAAGKAGVSKRSVASRFGRRAALFVAGSSLLLAVSISPLPYALGILGTSYLATVCLADAAFVWCLVGMRGARSTRDFHGLSRRIKLGMNLGFLAFLIGALF
jgi:geranylgeranylglycerol-phosphate geranylgeranyltransferase